MRKFFLFIAIILISFSVSAEVIISKEDMSLQMEKVTETLTTIMPENISALTVSPSAHIGKFFPAFPPHFEIGTSFSGTAIDTSFAKTSSDTFIKMILDKTKDVGLNFEINDNLILPTCAVNARIGGLFLPFDIGVFGVTIIPDTIEKLDFDDFSSTINYLTFGGDIRYALYEGNIILPKISLGAGYFYAQQELGFSVTKAKSGKYVDPLGVEQSGLINIDGNANILIKTHTFFAQLQISKKIFFITPFVGARAYYTFFENECDWNYKTQITISDSTPIVISENGEKFTTERKDFQHEFIQPQLYVGAGLNILLLQIGLNVSWNPVSNYWSGGISATLKI